MEQLKISSSLSQDVTVIPNDFLDRYLPSANGDFIKVYLCLMCAVGKHESNLTLCRIADRLNCTENDVLRALTYWEKEGVLALTPGENDAGSEAALTAVADCPGPKTSALTKPSDVSSEKLAALGETEEIRELFFIAQQYLGRPLKRGDMQAICYYYDGLHFPPDLIDYLIEYCVNHGHTQLSYINRVAENWKAQGFLTVHDAKNAVTSYHREYYDILKALGITNHHPIEQEITLMKKWLEDYRFSMEIITDACTRTVMNASRPSLSYTDSILSKWHRRNVRTLEDVKALDDEHERAAAEKTAQSQSRQTAKPKNSFNDFEQRDYDYDQLTKKLVNRTPAPGSSAPAKEPKPV